jgi:N-methylhydantoinase A
MLMVGVDIGGTFTDVVAVDPAAGLRFVKTPSTPDDPSRGVVDGLALLAAETGRSIAELLGSVGLFVHGTTVATNMLLQRNGARLGLITTEGFRDLLELRNGTKADRYRLRPAPPTPVIPRSLRLEVSERLRWDGEVETPLDRQQAARAVAALRNAGVEGVVVCLLHAHVDGTHERAIRDLIAESGWSPYVSLSHEVLSREGEFDRLGTAIVNAYVGPGLAGYLRRLEARLAAEGLLVPLRIMQSSGGVLPAERAGQHAVGAVTSGPAGGAMAGALFARAGNWPRAVTYDMGGTSTDIALVIDGIPVERHRAEVADLPITIPAVAIEALGAGGGSIAAVDAGGILSLGPESAGASPGPACYGRGSERPTTTDANVVLNLITPATFLGGRLSLSPAAAATAIDRVGGGRLGLSTEDAALAIHELATSKITEGIRLATVRRGMDPRDFVLISFGGAGGLHANAVARELSIPTVLIPRQASVLSALGFLAADIRHDLQRSVGQPIAELGSARIGEVFRDLSTAGRALLAAEGFQPEQMRLRWLADCRYARQVHSVPVQVQAADLDSPDLAATLERSFRAAYRDLYKHVHEEPAVLNTCRVAVFGALPKIDPAILAGDGPGDGSGAARGTRPVYLGRWVEASVHWFDALAPGARVDGPAIVESDSTTVLILEGSSGVIDEFGCLRISALRADA